MGGSSARGLPEIDVCVFTDFTITVRIKVENLPLNRNTVVWYSILIGAIQKPNN